MLYADFQNILKPVDKQYGKMPNKIKADRKIKGAYREKTNTHLPTEWCIHSMFSYKDIPDPLKMYGGECYGAHKRQGKVLVCKISTVTQDKTY